MKALEFIRVSGLKQDNERQRSIIEDYAKKNNIDLVKMPNAINNKISGLKELKKRPDLIALIQYLENNRDIKLVIASGLSRIGRTIEVILIIETLAKMGVNLYVIKERINTLDDNPQINYLIAPSYDDSLSFSTSTAWLTVTAEQPLHNSKLIATFDINYVGVDNDSTFFWYIKQRIKAIEDKKDKYTLDDMIRRH